MAENCANCRFGIFHGEVKHEIPEVVTTLTVGHWWWRREVKGRSGGYAHVSPASVECRNVSREVQELVSRYAYSTFESYRLQVDAGFWCSAWEGE